MDIKRDVFEQMKLEQQTLVLFDAIAQVPDQVVERLQGKVLLKSDCGELCKAPTGGWLGAFGKLLGGVVGGAVIAIPLVVAWWFGYFQFVPPKSWVEPRPAVTQPQEVKP
jgi:hypothetical protein